MSGFNMFNGIKSLYPKDAWGFAGLVVICLTIGYCCSLSHSSSDQKKIENVEKESGLINNYNLYLNIRGRHSMKWTTTRTPNVDKELKADFQAGRISSDDIAVISSWVDQVEAYGPDSLRKVWGTSDQMNPDVLDREPREVNLWNDHDLHGHLEGCRSSSFSRLGRIIYKVVDAKVQIVEIQKITPDHKY